ncbi:hypothetical protein SAMN05660862_3802 [Sphingobacterium psychroaquaticum]|uniref:Uncharacterized protein n=1 Tax=Sphingobacterium psychroaquaticum TaxID=561061 RepID=A0A1X7LC08_9SPHI|nr:hypothetical protein SAMN05660862_3802 [Sphingobacterium psychroaquaticum]
MVYFIILVEAMINIKWRLTRVKELDEEGKNERNRLHKNTHSIAYFNKNGFKISL